jgi:hypothetical protein
MNELLGQLTTFELFLLGEISLPFGVTFMSAPTKS